jgi:hypothetical protein
MNHFFPRNALTVLATALLFAAVTASHAGAGCATQNPSGPRAVLECMALELGFADGNTLWTKKLFHPNTLDAFCSSTLESPNVIESQLFAESCQFQKKSYFSYENFLDADEELRLKLGASYQFMRTGLLSVKLQELANFLATASQETSGNGLLATRYEQDGLYFRYEVRDPLRKCWQPVENPNYTSKKEPEYRTALSSELCNQKSTASFVTDYYPYSTYVVAVQEGTGLINTQFVSDSDCQYSLKTPIATFSCWDNTTQSSKRPTIIGGAYPAPTGYAWQFMNKIIEPGYWIGMGNLQLTGVAMTQFFGWYYQNMVTPKQDDASMQAFVKEYLKNGKRAWTGGLWYWNFRSNGMNGDGSSKPTLHETLTNSKDACHDIGITTVLVNGTQCNDTPGRTAYYNYYKSNVFKLTDVAKKFTYGTTTSTSMICSEAILNYCTK